MNKIFTNIRAYFARLSHQSQQDTALRVQQAAAKEAERTLQIREFQGELYLSFNNRPILPFNGRDNEEQKEAQNIAVEVLSIARETYRDYIIAQEKKISLWEQGEVPRMEQRIQNQENLPQLVQERKRWTSKRAATHP